MDYNKMKVNDLKAELTARNLDTKGVKAVLVERLKEAIEKENTGNAADSTPSVAANKKLDVGTPNQSTPVRRSRRRSMTRSPSPTKPEVSTLESVSEEPEQPESAEAISARKKRRTRSITKSPSPTRAADVKRLEVLEEEPDTAEKAAEPVTPTKKAEPTESVKTPQQKHEATPTKAAAASPAASSPAKKTPTPKQPEPAAQPKEVTPVKSAETLPAKSANEPSSETASAEPTKDVEASEETAEQPEQKEETEDNEEEKTSTDTKEEGTPKAAKRKSTSPPKESPSKTARTKPAQMPIEFIAEENEPEVDGDKFSLSWFDSDLNLEIDPQSLDSAQPISEGALALLWAGARSNLGVTKGKVAYEVILTKANETRKVTEEPVTSEFRVGWSPAGSSLQVGEDKLSFAYASTASKGTDSKFSDYGVEYKVNDVVGVYLDLDSSPCKIEFTVNNVSQGTAFEFDKAELNGEALFPHVCSKNIAFKVNFGQLERSLLNDREKPKKPAPAEEPKSEPAVESAKNDSETKDTEEEKKAADEGTETAEQSEEQKSEKQAEEQKEEVKEEQEAKDEKEEAKEEKDEEQPEQFINPDYIYVAKSPKENLVAGASRPASRKDCEVILLIGLPASGKTHWVQNYLKENPDKKVTVLSVDSLLSQMKLAGEPRKPSNTTKWSKLVEQLSKALNKLNDIAAKRRRNFILDQNNVFASEQKRRLRGFGEYAARKAVIVVPDEEEHSRRIKARNEALGIEFEEGNTNAMKAHFLIPPKDLGWFTEVTYAELDEEKTAERVKKVNEIGRKALPRGGYNRNQQQNQQQRRGGGQSNQRWNQGYGNNRYGGQNYRQGYNAQQQRYSTQNYSQNRNYQPGSGYGRRDSSGYGGAQYGNTGSNWMRNTSGRYDNRYNNRGGYQGSQTRRYDSNYNRGYNNSGSGWNQQNSNGWGGYGSQGNDTQQWYSWWQSNLKNLLQQQGSDGNSQQANMEQYWSQYAQQHNYGNNYQQSKSYGSGPSSKNK